MTHLFTLFVHIQLNANRDICNSERHKEKIISTEFEYDNIWETWFEPHIFNVTCPFMFL